MKRTWVARGHRWLTPSAGFVSVLLEMEKRDRPSGLAQLAKTLTRPMERGMALCSISDRRYLLNGRP
jgi:hypothetical protein